MSPQCILGYQSSLPFCGYPSRGLFPSSLSGPYDISRLGGLSGIHQTPAIPGILVAPVYALPFSPILIGLGPYVYPYQGFFFQCSTGTPESTASRFVLMNIDDVRRQRDQENVFVVPELIRSSPWPPEYPVQHQVGRTSGPSGPVYQPIGQSLTEIMAGMPPTQLPVLPFGSFVPVHPAVPQAWASFAEWKANQANQANLRSQPAENPFDRLHDLPTRQSPGAEAEAWIWKQNEETTDAQQSTTSNHVPGSSLLTREEDEVALVANPVAYISKLRENINYNLAVMHLEASERTAHEEAVDLARKVKELRGRVAAAAYPVVDNEVATGAAGTVDDAAKTPKATVEESPEESHVQTGASVSVFRKEGSEGEDQGKGKGKAID